MKMKMSIIVGVSHMIVGIFFSLLNHIHFKSVLNILCEFLPQMLMMLALFGYLSIIIIYKWVTPADGEHKKPQLIRTLINMFLNFTKDVEDEERLYSAQKPIEVVLVVIFVLTIVWMLVPKPIILIIQNRKKGKVDHLPARYEGSGSGSGSSNLPKGAYEMKVSVSSIANEGESLSKEEEEEEEFVAGEVFVHQLIETIEFTLGCISNTASYLRLWALSLAHGELAEVFFNYAMITIPRLIPVIGSWIGVAVWLGATFMILMAMEGLSAFLHCLRLHWVELQNKFYKAEGYEFTPLSFKLIDKQNNIDDDISGSTNISVA